MNEKKYIKIRDEFFKEVEPKALEANVACWDFYINSTSENMEKYQKLQDDVYSFYKNEKVYNELKILNKSGLLDKHLSKQLKHLINDFEDEIDSGVLKKQLREKENQIAAKYNSYVPTIDDVPLSKPELLKIIETEKDVKIREKAYNARIKGGDLIKDDLVEFVKMRNEFAKTKGYNNFFEYTLKETYDVEPEYLQKLLDDVYEQAKPINKIIQDENKEKLAKVFGINKEDLKAYHLGLLLEDSPVKEVNKNLKSTEDIVNLSINTYKNMGYDVEDLPITLDLFPRKNKNTHGFCFDIDAGKDARILANLTNNSTSIDTLCHELGHCVYHLGIDEKLPCLEKNAYPAVTEAIAMMMGDLQQKEDILKDIVDKETLDKLKKEHKKDEAKFISRSMLIIDFEKQMYENPEQDLSELWRNLRYKYLGTNKDDVLNNEWATIPHYLSHPAYYQNYFRANIMKAQMYNYLKNKLGNISENEKTSEVLDNELFKYGMSLEEDNLIEKFTKEPLSTKYLCESLK